MGHFSWIAQDTKSPVYIDGYQKPGYAQRTYYLWDNKGNSWKEASYEGYGMFGNKDYYILLAEMNRTYGEDVTEDKKRNDGIDISFRSKSASTLFPNITETSVWKWRNKEPVMHYNQGCYEGGWDEEE
jgi:hypothetical protein